MHARISNIPINNNASHNASMPILRMFSVYKTTTLELPKMKFALTLILSGFQSDFSTQNLGDHSLSNICE